jgi:hypothetical protein
MGAHNYSNITSIGVSYTWENTQGQEGTANASPKCTTTPAPTNPNLPDQIKKKSDHIRRVQKIDVQSVQVDTSAAGGVMASAQNSYNTAIADGDSHELYMEQEAGENIHIGGGVIKNASVDQSSSNLVTLSVSYENDTHLKDANDQSTKEEDPDPVSRTEQITVSRDIVNKAYKIEHSYSVSFGSDFDAVTDHPLYEDDSSYASASARLDLAQSEAESAVFDDPKDYNDILDLSAYQTEEGWDVAALENGCSGLSYSTSKTKDFINGDYSYVKTTDIKYTGTDIDTGDAEYNVNYSIDWNMTKEEDVSEACLLMSMKGSIEGKREIKSDKCTGLITAAQAARSGFEEWVEGGSGEERMREVYEWIVENVELQGVGKGDLKPGMTNLKSSSCLPSIDKGVPNDAVIEFEFGMDNCSSSRDPKVPEEGSPYLYAETQSTSYSWEKDCNDVERKITNFTVNGSVNGVCGTQYDNKRWASVADTYEGLKATGRETASGYSDHDDWNIISSSDSINEYGANGSFSWTYSDKGTGCKKESEFNACHVVDSRIESGASTERVVEQYTAGGIIEQSKGNNRAVKNVSLTIENKQTSGCDSSYTGFLDTAKEELNKVSPDCVINGLSWTFKTSFTVGGADASSTLECSMEGVD